MKAGAVVRRYAAALFAVAKEKNLIEDLGREVDFLSELFSDRSVQSFLRNPQIGTAEKRKVFLDKVGPHVSPLMRNFVNLLFDRGREEVLEGLSKAYQAISNQALGIAQGHVESAKPLSETERTELEAALSKQFGLRVKLTQQHVPSLIGGLRVTVGHRRIDLTVHSTLAEIKARLMSAPVNKK